MKNRITKLERRRPPRPRESGIFIKRRSETDEELQRRVEVSGMEQVVILPEKESLT